MIAILSFIFYIVSSLTAAYFYVKSVSPAQLERHIGEHAYPQCARYRMISMLAMTVALITFILCRNFPVTRALPSQFAWPRWLSLVIAMLLGVPSLALLITGMQDAGSETLTPSKKNKLIKKGIYAQLRHPQAYEALLWPAIAFGLHSPLLLLLSIPWMLLEIIMVMAEEIDLIIRFGEPYLAYREKTGAFFPSSWNAGEWLQIVVDKIKALFPKE